MPAVKFKKGLQAIICSDPTRNLRTWADTLISAGLRVLRAAHYWDQATPVGKSIIKITDTLDHASGYGERSVEFETIPAPGQGKMKRGEE